MENLGKAMLFIGIALLVVTVSWWHVHYTEVADEVVRVVGRYSNQQITSMDYIACLYADEPRQCSSTHVSIPRPPYILFWVGAISFIGGIALTAAGTASRPNNTST